MTEYLAYFTREGDRWDLIAFRFYGDVRRQDRLIAANPECAIAPLLPPGLRLRVPLIEEPPEAPPPLPPWKHPWKRR